MEIFFVTERFHPLYGGAENRYLELGKVLSNRGHTVNVISGLGDIINLKQKNTLVDIHKIHQKYDNITIHRIFNYRNRTNHQRSIGDCIQLGIQTSKFLNKRMKNIEIDIIDVNIVPYLHLPFFDFIIKQKYVVTWHEVIGEDWKDWGIRGIFGKRIEKINANLGEHKIAVSEFTRKKLKIISKNSNISTIKNGVSSKFLEIENQATEVMNLLYIGRLEPHKNILNILIPSFLDVLKFHPGAVLRIAGTGSERSKISDIAKNHPNINYYDSIDENQKKVLYSISDIFLLVSSREGSGIVVLEANASGLPVVTVKFPNNSVAYEGIKEGVNGKITDARNIVSAILHVYENIDRYRKSSKGYARNFTWEKLVEKFEKIYYKIS